MENSRYVCHFAWIFQTCFSGSPIVFSKLVYRYILTDSLKPSINIRDNEVNINNISCQIKYHKTLNKVLAHVYNITASHKCTAACSRSLFLFAVVIKRAVAYLLVVSTTHAITCRNKPAWKSVCIVHAFFVERTMKTWYICW